MLFSIYILSIFINISSFNKLHIFFAADSLLDNIKYLYFLNIFLRVVDCKTGIILITNYLSNKKFLDKIENFISLTKTTVLF